MRSLREVGLMDGEVVTNRRRLNKPSTPMVITLVCAIIGWGLGLFGMVRAADLRMLTEAIVAERDARSASDITMSDTMKQVSMNTKDVPALVAQMRIVLRKLGLEP